MTFFYDKILPCAGCGILLSILTRKSFNWVQYQAFGLDMASFHSLSENSKLQGMPGLTVWAEQETGASNMES